MGERNRWEYCKNERREKKSEHLSAHISVTGKKGRKPWRAGTN